MFYFYTNILKFTPKFMGKIKAFHTIGTLVGVFLYNKYLKKTPFNL